MTGARIAGGEVAAYDLPLARPYVTARGRIDSRRVVLLRLESEDGILGWGEGVPLSMRGGDAAEAVIEALERWLERHAGSRNEPAIGPEGATAVDPDAPPPARAAAAMALADIAARRRGIPVWQLLGAECAAPIPCNATLVSGEPDAVAADASDWAGAGFETFKLKLGAGPAGRSDASRDAATVRAVREAVGVAARIRVDANGSWSPDEASRFLELCGEQLELVEQPVPGLPEMSAIENRRGVPIAADESVNNPAEAREARDLGACELATVKLSKVGAFPGSLDGEIPIYLSSAIDGPIGIAAAAHAFQALGGELARLPSRPGGYDPSLIAQGLATQRLLSESYAKRECTLRGDRLHLPAGPGLGVEVDEPSLIRLRV